MDTVEEVRSFNRFYTREIGLLRPHLPASDLTLAEARVVYELATAGEQTAAALGRRLGMDKAHLSRIAGRLRARGLVESRVGPDHGRQKPLSLTQAGRATFARLESGTRAQLETLLAPVDGAARARMVEAMAAIRTALGEDAEKQVALRGLEPGDLGWITHRQAVLYTREYGWDWTYEGLVSTIIGRFVETFDPARDDAWVATRGGAIVGSVFLVHGDRPGEAKLRLLYVEPSARGLGVGRRLVERCIARATELGYRRLVLWTNDVLVAARRLYQAAGFRLVEEAPHHSFGKDLVGQTWALDLHPAEAG